MAEYLQAHRLPAPGPGALGQLLYGLSLPLHLGRILWRDVDARRRYLGVCAAQLVVVTGLGLVFMKSGQEVASTVPAPPPKPHVVLGVPLPPPPPPMPGIEAPKGEEDDADGEEDADRAREAAEHVRAIEEAVSAALKEAGLSEQGSGEAVPAVPVPPPPTSKEQLKAKVQAAEAAIQAALEKGPADPEAAKHLKAATKQINGAMKQLNAVVKQAAAEKKRAQRLHFSRWKEFTVTDVEFWAALLAAMQITQWVVIALSRDYHKAISQDLSRLTKLPLEDEPVTPRVRLNMPWLRYKAKSRVRALLIFSVGVPLLWVSTLCVPLYRHAVLTALMSVWGYWWFAVFTAGKSARAWENPAAPEPWFLRGWNALLTRVAQSPLRMVHGPLSAYGNVWATFSRSMFSPAACVERQPWVFAGLAVSRLILSLPGVKCFSRPLFPVASAHLLEAYRVAHPAPASSPVAAPAAEPVPAPARVSSDG